MGSVLKQMRTVARLAFGEGQQRAPILLLQIQHLQHRYASGDKQVTQVFDALDVTPLEADGTPRSPARVYDELGKSLNEIIDRRTFDQYVDVLLNDGSVQNELK